jgi:cytochrome d ubiquinol oxidase subunit II
MLLVWFAFVAFMITMYVILDGFDLGVGVMHLFAAQNEAERRIALRSIGPVWDGNEVWLIAGGGTLYFAFPLLYASAFSGFYLSLMIVLWLLILRAIGIEFRMHLDSPVWSGFFDGCFALSSLLLIIFYGAALGNVVRGVPLQPDGYFFIPLWTNWRVGPSPGILDWYTLISAVVAVIALTIHGALYLTLKTTGDLNARARGMVSTLWPALLIITLVSLLATIRIRPELLGNYLRFPVLFIIPIVVIASLTAILRFNHFGRERAAFLASCVYLGFTMCGAAVALYPNLLMATTDPSLNLTVYNARSGDHALRIGLIWWTFGMALAVGYFVFVYRMFRGKITEVPAGHA